MMALTLACLTSLPVSILRLWPVFGDSGFPSGTPTVGKETLQRAKEPENEASNSEDVRYPMKLMIASVLFVFCVSCSPQQSSRTIDLVQEFPWARHGDVISLDAPLGSFGARPFWWKGLVPSPDPEVVQTFADAKEVGFRSYFFERVPARLVLEGKRRQGQATSEVLWNGRVIGRMKLTPEWTRASFPIPADSVSIGENRVEVKSAELSLWRHFSVTQLVADGAELEVGSARYKPQDDSVYLPFGGQLVYPVELQGRSRLAFRVEPWTEEGAPALETGDWEGLVALRDERNKLVTESKVTSSGKHTVELPVAQGQAALHFSARLGSAEPPLPGQLGLKLQAVRLEDEGSTAQEASQEFQLNPTGANVIMISIDTLRADHLGCYGHEKPTTPYLDELAGDSVLFEQCMAQSPWTKPSMASLLTSQLPYSHGVLDFADVLPESAVTLADLLNEAGYETMAVWTNGLLGQEFGIPQGFRKTLLLGNHLTADAVFKRANLLLSRRDPQRPFFLHVHLLDPHMPYNPPSSFREKMYKAYGVDQSPWPEGLDLKTHQQLQQRVQSAFLKDEKPSLTGSEEASLKALYDGEVAFTDKCVGDFVQRLKKYGLYENSFIVIVSDHGEEILEHRGLGHLQTLHPELIRVPLLIKYPGSKNGGQRIASPVQHIDILPTLIDNLGLPLAPTLEGEPIDLKSPSQRPIFFSVQAGPDAIEAGQQDHSYLEYAQGLRVGDWVTTRRLAGTVARQPLALYDLAQDPEQENNLFFQEPVRALHLQARLKKHFDPLLKQTSREKLKIDRSGLEKNLRTLQYL